MRKLLIRKNKDKKYVAAITTIELVLILVINLIPYFGVCIVWIEWKCVDKSY